MQNLFVKEDDEFEVRFTVAIDKDGTIFCDLNEESLRESVEGLADLKECEVKSYKAVFKKPSFGDTVELYQSVFDTTEMGNMTFNPILARYKKISELIKSWDLTGEEKKPTPQEIKKLHPVVANAIGIQVDLETGGLMV
jgi:hypothetical protein